MISYLDTTDNQFGFKKGHSIDHCIFTLKNIIQYYRSNTRLVYSCFLDASKAFDSLLLDTLKKNPIKAYQFYLSISCYTGTEPKHFVSNVALLPLTFTVTNGV